MATQADLDALEAAIFSGTKRVEYSDKKVEYQSMKEMLQARDLLKKELGQTTGRFYRLKPEFDKSGDGCDEGSEG